MNSIAYFEYSLQVNFSRVSIKFVHIYMLRWYVLDAHFAFVYFVFFSNMGIKEKFKEGHYLFKKSGVQENIFAWGLSANISSLFCWFC